MVSTNLTYTPIYAHIVGWGMAVPDRVMTNDDMAAIVETSDEWIQARTGIKQRHIAGEHETTSTLGIQAARRALEIADILPIELDLIVVSTSTPDFVFPSTASLIQDGLGAGRAGAFDLSAACSGFVYALDMAAQSIRSGSIETALVIGSETMSRVLNWQDRSTCILFGDGAGAVVLRGRTEPGGVLSSVLRSDGAGCDLLGIPSVGGRESATPGLSIDGHRLHKMHMVGGEVFKFATRVIGESIRESAHKAGIGVEELALIVPHQANQRIIAAAARSLGVDTDRFMSNVAHYGNTSAASIPIALVEAIEDGRLHPGDHLAMVGFGGGLAWAAMTIQWTGPHERDIRFGSQRRWFSYTAARWRYRVRRVTRRYGDLANRVRPQRGRMQRLRRRVDQSELE